MDSKRLSIDMHKDLHREIKIIAAEQNITMAKWVLQAIIKEMALQKSYE